MKPLGLLDECTKYRYTFKNLFLQIIRIQSFKVGINVVFFHLPSRSIIWNTQNNEIYIMK